MGAVRSSNGYLGFVKQAAKGSGAAPTKFCRLSGPDGWEVIHETMDIRSLNADEEIDDILKTRVKLNITFDTLARPELTAAIMAFVLGADSVTTGIVHTHTITRADTVPWLSIERQLDNVERAEDCKINQVVINGAAGQPVSINVQALGNDSNIQSAASDTYETGEPFMFHDGVFTIDGSANTNISAFTLTITRNIQELQTNSIKNGDLLENGFTIDLSYTTVFQSSDADYAATNYGASTALTDVMDDGAFIATFSYGSGATERQFKFTLPALKLKSRTKHLDPNSTAVMLETTASAVKSGAAIITVECKNTTATAYV
jgi:hypothetical protein